MRREDRELKRRRTWSLRFPWRRVVGKSSSNFASAG